MKKLSLCNAKEITVTNAQYETAKEWAWRTLEEPEEFAYPSAVFSFLDNVDRGHRRCCNGLIKAGVLRGNAEIGYVLDTAVRYRMMQEL